MKDIDAVLDKHDLRKTPLRRKIVEAFVQSRSSLSQGDLIQRLARVDDKFDRVSIYRNLSQLKEAGVLHEVEVNNYIYCSHECAQHGHLLLFCQVCHKHREIKDHARIEKFMTAIEPFHFFGHGRSISLRGVCADCQ